MSLAKERLIALMQYADGELDGDDRTDEHEAIMALLESNDESGKEARAFLDEMDHLAEATREAEPLALPDTVLAFDIADAVMADVEEHEQKLAITTKLGQPEKKGASVSHISVAGPASVSSLEIAREKRRRVGVIVVTGLALAAGIALVMRTHPSEDMRSAALQKPVAALTASGAPITSVASPPGSPTSEAALAAANANANSGDKASEQGVEVNISDSPQTGVSVFYLPGSDVTSASAVVWIDETAGGKK